jgi:sphinganine-1-phosphate aldolase
MCFTCGITSPEMIIAHSAHPAFIKAAEYFKLRAVRVPVGADGRLSARTVVSALSPNTVLVVASCPGFPHGLMDHVADISAVCTRRRIPLHVDCCLGGFVLPFARRLGYRVPPFDFSLPAVTSISVDTHKFAMGHKGTSVVLFRNKSIRSGERVERRARDWALAQLVNG